MSHHSEFEDKKQVNVYLPEDDDEFIEDEDMESED